MNWTGGQHTLATKSKLNGPAARQKQYFARIRAAQETALLSSPASPAASGTSNVVKKRKRPPEFDLPFATAVPKPRDVVMAAVEEELPLEATQVVKKRDFMAAMEEELPLEATQVVKKRDLLARKKMLLGDRNWLGIGDGREGVEDQRRDEQRAEEVDDPCPSQRPRMRGALAQAPGLASQREKEPNEPGPSQRPMRRLLAQAPVLAAHIFREQPSVVQRPIFRDRTQPAPASQRRQLSPSAITEVSGFGAPRIFTQGYVRVGKGPLDPTPTSEDIMLFDEEQRYERALQAPAEPEEQEESEQYLEFTHEPEEPPEEPMFRSTPPERHPGTQGLLEELEQEILRFNTPPRDLMMPEFSTPVSPTAYKSQILPAQRVVISSESAHGREEESELEGNGDSDGNAQDAEREDEDEPLQELVDQAPIASSDIVDIPTPTWPSEPSLIAYASSSSPEPTSPVPAPSNIPRSIVGNGPRPTTQELDHRWQQFIHSDSTNLPSELEQHSEHRPDRPPTNPENADTTTIADAWSRFITGSSQPSQSPSPSKPAPAPAETTSVSGWTDFITTQAPAKPELPTKPAPQAEPEPPVFSFTLEEESAWKSFVFATPSRSPSPLLREPDVPSDAAATVDGASPVPAVSEPSGEPSLLSDAVTIGSSGVVAMGSSGVVEVSDVSASGESMVVQGGTPVGIKVFRRPQPYVGEARNELEVLEDIEDW